MSEKTMLYVLLVIGAATLYITYMTATGLQAASGKIEGVIKNPLSAFGL
jgi:hypothetical protein